MYTKSTTLYFVLCFLLVFSGCSALNQAGNNASNSINSIDFTDEISEDAGTKSSEAGFESDDVGMSIPVTIAKAEKGFIDSQGLGLGLSSGLAETETEETEDAAVKESTAGTDEDESADDTTEDEEYQIVLRGQVGAVPAGANLRLHWLMGDEDVFVTADADGVFEHLLDPDWLGHMLLIEVLGTDSPTKINMLASSNGSSFFVGFVEEYEGLVQNTGLTVYNDFVFYYKKVEGKYAFTYRNLHDVTQTTFVTSDDYLRKVTYFPERTYNEVVYPEMIFGITEQGSIVKQTKNETEVMFPVPDTGKPGEGEDSQDFVEYAASPSGLFLISYSSSEAGHTLLKSLAVFSEKDSYVLTTLLDSLIIGRYLVWIDTYNVLSYTYFKQKEDLNEEELNVVDNLSNIVESEQEEGMDALLSQNSMMYERLFDCIENNDFCSVVEFLDMNSFTNPGHPEFGKFDVDDDGNIKVESRILHVVQSQLANAVTTDYIRTTTEPYFSGNIKDDNGNNQIFIGGLENGENSDDEMLCPIRILTSGETNKGIPAVAKQGLFIAYEDIDGYGKTNIRIMYVPTEEKFWLMPAEFTNYEFFNPQFSKEAEFGLSFLYKNKEDLINVGTVNLRNHPQLKQIFSELEDKTKELQEVELFNNCFEIDSNIVITPTE